MKSPQETDELKDTRHRKLPLQINWELDELPITLEAFRVYAHLIRCAAKTGSAWPSYNTIGEKCFRGSYPNAAKSTLKNKAIAAVRELVAWDLVLVEHRYSAAGDATSNIYTLTDRDEWRESPESFTSINIRSVGGTAVKRKSKGSRNAKVVNGDNQVVNGDNQGVVNGDNQGGCRGRQPRLTGITTLVNGDNYPPGLKGASNHHGIRVSGKAENSEDNQFNLDPNEVNQTLSGGTPNPVPPNPLPAQSECVRVEELSERQEEETALSRNLTPSHDDAPSTSPEHKTTSLLANQPSKEDQNFRADCKDLQQKSCQNKQDVVAKRFVDSYTGKQSSCAEDPWMENHNPVPAFKEWLFQKQKANGWKNASPANAASEIRKDYVRASEHWQEFLADNVKQFQGCLSRVQSGLALATDDWEWLKAIAPHTPDKTLVEAVMAICGREQQKEGESLCTVRETQCEAKRPEIAWEMGTDPIAEIMKRKKPIRIAGWNRK